MRAKVALGSELELVTPGELDSRLSGVHHKLDRLDMFGRRAMRDQPPIHDTLYPTEARAASAAGPNIVWFQGPTVGQLWNLTGVVWVAGDDHTAVGGTSLQSAAGAAPAAGADWSVTVPAGQQWQLQSLDFTLVTSATVANRIVQVVIDDGVNVLWKWVSPVTQTATQTIEYTGAQGSVESAAARNGVVLFELPAITLGPGYRVRTVTAAIAAADQYGAPRLGYLLTQSAATVAVYKASGAQGAGLAAAQLLSPGGAGNPIPGQYSPPRLAVWLHPMDGLVLAFYNVPAGVPLYAVAWVDKYSAAAAEASRLP